MREDDSIDIWTIPNAICVLRIVASPVLVVLALADRPRFFLGMYLILAVSDWLDGKLAILLHQRSKIGPKLDTVSDASMYVCLLIGLVWLKHAFFWSEIGWIIAASASYVVSVGISLAKFGHWPSYHTRAAKISWFLVLVAVIVMMLEGPAWPFRLAAAMVALTNLETAAMSVLLKQPQTDVGTIVDALRRQRNQDMA